MIEKKIIPENLTGLYFQSPLYEKVVLDFCLSVFVCVCVCVCAYTRASLAPEPSIRFYSRSVFKSLRVYFS
jgi:hypothetical protein